MRADGVDGVFYATSSNMQYFLDDTSYTWQRSAFTGFVIPGPNGHHLNVPDCVLYIPTEDEPILFMSYQREKDMKHLPFQKRVGYFVCMSNLMEGYIQGKKLAVGESCNHFLSEAVKEVLPEAELVDGEHYGTELRAVKDAMEIALMREVCKLTDESMGKVVEILRPGITNAEVEDYIGKIGYEAGCVELPFPPTSRFYKTGGDEPFQVDGFRTKSVLKAGSSISFDYGYTLHGYCSDFGRSFYSGKAPEEIKDGYKALQEAQVMVIERLKPGDPMDYGFDMIWDHLKKRGYGDCLRHYYHFDLLGHQVGIDVHEGPWLHNEQKKVFEPGMIFTVEPKFWWPGKCFMRVEDMILITETGAECLTNFSRDLFELPAD